MWCQYMACRRSDRHRGQRKEMRAEKKQLRGGGVGVRAKEGL